MKKLLIAMMVALVMLTGCKEADPVPNDTTVEAFRVDMSGYQNMPSTNHQFMGVNPSELLKVIEEDRSAIFYIGYLGCGNCQQAVQYINKAASELGVTVYYMDCYGTKEDFNEYVDEFVTVLDPILKADPDGDKGIFTPHVFAVVNGELMDSKVGCSLDGTEKSANALVEDYKEIMRYFVTAE